MVAYGGNLPPLNREIADKVLELLTEGKSMLDICEMPGMPTRRTIYRWVEADPELAAHFARARESGAEVLIDRAQRVADDSEHDVIVDDDGRARQNSEFVQRSKLRVDTLFKRAANYCPRRFGTKVALGGDDEAPAIKIEGPKAPPTTDLIASAAKLAALAAEFGGEEPAEDGNDTDTA